MIIQFSKHVFVQSDLFLNVIRKTIVYAIEWAYESWNTELILQFFKFFFTLFLCHVYFIIDSFGSPALQICCQLSNLIICCLCQCCCQFFLPLTNDCFHFVLVVKQLVIKITLKLVCLIQYVLDRLMHEVHYINLWFIVFLLSCVSFMLKIHRKLFSCVKAMYRASECIANGKRDIFPRINIDWIHNFTNLL